MAWGHVTHRAKQVHHKAHQFLHGWAASHHGREKHTAEANAKNFHAQAERYHKRKRDQHAEHYHKLSAFDKKFNSDTPMQRTAAYAGSQGTGASI